MAERTVACAMPAGPVPVAAVLQRGGLALHPHPDLAGGRAPWTITHVGSGLAVLKGIPTRAEGVLLLRVLLGFGDWTRAAGVLQRDRALSRRVRPIWDRLLRSE